MSTTLGTIGKQSTTANGIAQSIFKSGSSGTVKVTAKLDNQTSTTSVKIIDTIPPKVISRYPKNTTEFSKAGTISIKFSEVIKTGINYSKIYIKNLKTGKIVSINKRVNGNTLSIKTTSKRLAYTWYQVILPIGAVKDYAGNNLLNIYQFKFKTGP